jgi:DNA-directed RNA polymerase specialized sigma24 family protein
MKLVTLVTESRGTEPDRPLKAGNEDFGYRFLRSYRVLYLVATYLLQDRQEAQQVIQSCFFTAIRQLQICEDDQVFRDTLLRVLIEEARLVRCRRRIGP